MKIPSKEALRNQKWKPHKYQAGNNILEAKYHTSATKAPIAPNIYTFTTEYMLRTFTYLEPVDGKNSFTGKVIDDFTDDVVTDMATDVTNNEMTDGHITREKVTNIDFGEITRNVSEYVTDEADYFAKEDADITILSSITTTEKCVSHDEPTKKYRHVDDFRIPNKTRIENETKSDYDKYSDYYDVQYDSTLQQLVSFIYINNKKNEKDVKSLDLPTSIKPKKVTTTNMISEAKTAANKKASLWLKKQNLLNRPIPNKLNKAKSQTKGQRPRAKSINTKNSKTVSKTGRLQFIRHKS